MDQLVIELTPMENELVTEASQLATGDKFLNLTILDSYLEKYPEDVCKWSGHLKESMAPLHRDARDVTDDVLNAHIIQQDAQAPTNNEPCCEVCKKSFASTQVNPTMTLLCKHTCHTVCYFMYQNDNDKSCPNAGCNINMWRIARKINENNVATKKGVTNMFIKRYKDNPDFKNDISELKEYIKQVSLYKTKMFDLIKDEKKVLLEKHAYALQAIQNELNKLQASEKDLSEYKSCKLWVMKYRRLSRKILRQYNLSFYELNKYRLIQVRGHVRRILDNDDVSPRWFKRIIIAPGSKKWI